MFPVEKPPSLNHSFLLAKRRCASQKLYSYSETRVFNGISAILIGKKRDFQLWEDKSIIFRSESETLIKWMSYIYPRKLAILYEILKISIRIRLYLQLREEGGSFGIGFYSFPRIIPSNDNSDIIVEGNVPPNLEIRSPSLTFGKGLKFREDCHHYERTLVSSIIRLVKNLTHRGLGQKLPITTILKFESFRNFSSHRRKKIWARAPYF